MTARSKNWIYSTTFPNLRSYGAGMYTREPLKRSTPLFTNFFLILVPEQLVRNLINFFIRFISQPAWEKFDASARKIEYTIEITGIA